jgi:PPOX class probable F420-dependent enzyme
MMKAVATDMTPEQRRAFLSEGTRTGKLAVVRADGRPHVTPIWFVLDGDDLVLTTGTGSLKAKAMRRDPRVTVCVDDQVPPFSFVMVEGTVEISDDLDALLIWATRIGERYMGPERAEEFGRRNAVPEELLVRVSPTHVVAVADVSA